MTSKALGKGLSALIPEKEKLTPQSEGVSHIDVSLIRNNTLQPRKEYDQDKLDELKASIKEKGVLQPILVRQVGGEYEVIAGERRLRASRQLDIKEIPALIKEVSDREALVIALVENIQREELNPIEEAQAFKRLVDDFAYSQEDVAKSVGKDRSTISNMLRLLKLPEEIQQSVSKEELSVGHARALLGIESFIEQSGLYKRVLRERLSVRELEALITQEKTPTPARQKKIISKPQQIISLEENLQKLMGTKVTVMPKKKRGKIIIEYYSHEDLDRIVKLFIK